jgi:hypothetical protein
MAEPIPALTIWQPWASLIAEGIKVWEFRSWPPPQAYVGGRIAIHAGARPIRMAEVAGLIRCLANDRWRQLGLVDPSRALAILDRDEASFRDLPRACVIATATLGRPFRGYKLAWELAPGFDWAGEPTNWGYPLTGVRRLEPFEPALGRHRFWNWRSANG